MAAETRVTNPDTGGMKGSKDCQPFWIDSRGLTALGEVAGYGCGKYEPHNYRKGVSVSLHMNAAWRHILLFQGGEDLDSESGLPHLAHAAWNLLAAHTQTVDHPELDDRFVAEEPDMLRSLGWQRLDGDMVWAPKTLRPSEITDADPRRGRPATKADIDRVLDSWKMDTAPDIKGRDIPTPNL